MLASEGDLVEDMLDGGIRITHDGALPNPACCPLTVARHARQASCPVTPVLFLPLVPFFLFRRGQEMLQLGEVIGPLGDRLQVRIDPLRGHSRPAFHDARLHGGVGGSSEEQRHACAGQPFRDFLDKLR